MANVLHLFVALVLTLHAAHSYILLTANLEDVQTLAKQLASSPVVDQIQKIWRRASNQFTQHVSNNKPNYRGQDNLEDIKVKPEGSDNIPEGADGFQRRRSQPQESVHDELIALGKNASMYLKSIRKLFESA